MSNMIRGAIQAIAKEARAAVRRSRDNRGIAVPLVAIAGSPGGGNFGLNVINLAK